MADADTVPKETAAETHAFQAEVAELLRLMVHSVYSETDIFLRELISNASDACDRLRFEAIANPALTADGAPFVIRVQPDGGAGTLTIADNGVGMDRQELIDNLGTIARSGTRAFISTLAQANDGAALIGQFGIGFYSAFMVADRIEVVSRRAGSPEAWVWTSVGSGGFEITPTNEVQAARVRRGTEVVLYLKDTAKKYLEPHEIRRVISTYSDHIQFPIELGDDGKSEQINSASALWQRPKSDLKPEDYAEAYRTLAHAFDEPAMTLHYRAEGRQSYAVLLFAPSTKPFDLFDPTRKRHVKLYVRRVFITNDADLLPSYLRFIRGVVDSEDDLKPNQTEIYYLLGESTDRLKSNPKLEAARARGIEVLLLSDPIDALWSSIPIDFGGKPFKSLSKGEVDFGLVPLLDSTARDEAKVGVTDEAAVLAAVRTALGERVSDVRASQRLADSPACLVAAKHAPDLEIERLLASQNRGVRTKPILELNMRHALVSALAEAQKDARESDVSDLSSLLFEQAQILDGVVPDDPAAFAARLNRLVVRGLGVRS